MSGLMPPGPLAYEGEIAVPYIVRKFAPTSQNNSFTVPTIWVNPDEPSAYILVAKPQGVAQWDLLTSNIGNVSSLTGNDDVIVEPSLTGNINVVGDGTVITVTGTPSTNTELVAITGVVPVNHGGTGADSFTSGHILVGDGTSPITTTNTPSVASITIANAPISATDGANKAYVDEIGSGFTFIDAVLVACTIELDATYDNGTAGVGATLTNAGTQAAIVIDGVTLSVDERVLVQFQTTQYENGVYSVTDTGSILTNWVLTRTTDYDSVPPIAQGNLVPVQSGATWASTLWLQTFDVVTIGTDPIIFQTYTPVPSLQINVQTFTTSGTYTPTSGILYSIVEIVGGGSGGGGIHASAGTVSSNGGGGGGCYAKNVFTASELGASVDITIGAGGTAGTNVDNSGDGGTTMFGSLMTAEGGIGGLGPTFPGPATHGSGTAGGAISSGASLTIPGGAGFPGFGVISGGSAVADGGTGGSSALGSGNSTQKTSIGYGGGGAGGFAIGADTIVQGQAGSDGVCIITEYIQ